MATDPNAPNQELRTLIAIQTAYLAEMEGRERNRTAQSQTTNPESESQCKLLVL